MARKLSGDGRVSTLEVDPRRFFRVWDGASSRIIKVDRSRLSHERELQVIAAVDDILGAPHVLESGLIDDWYWISFADPGKWSLATVRNPEYGRRLAYILSQIHEKPFNGFPEPVITNDWIRHEYASVLRRLRPMRRQLGIEDSLLETLSGIPAPIGSIPRPAHMGSKGSGVFISSEETLTIMGWEDAGIAPPEWDITQMIAEFEFAPETSRHFEESLRFDVGPVELHRWMNFHAVRALLDRANNFDNGTSVRRLIERLERSVRIASLEKQPV